MHCPGRAGVLALVSWTLGNRFNPYNPSGGLAAEEISDERTVQPLSKREAGSRTGMAALRFEAVLPMMPRSKSRVSGRGRPRTMY